MALQVSGKTAIVTGAGSGINYEFAKLLLSKGCNVLIADLSLRPEAKELLTQYSAHSGGAKPAARAVFQETDVAKWEQLDRMFKAAVTEFGTYHIVCPGAGVFEPTWSNFWHPPGSGPSRDEISSSRYAVLDINLNHPLRCSQIAIEYFNKHKQAGTIVLISSIAGHIPFFPTPFYVASKHAISGFIQSMSLLETPPAGSSLPKIRINGVAPGIIKTPIWTEEKSVMVDEKSGDEWVSPAKVAEVMLSLIEEEEYVGGTILEVAAGAPRKIEVFNDPGPQGKGVSVSGAMIGVGAVFGILEEQQKK